jgi:hypothetical protein
MVRIGLEGASKGNNRLVPVQVPNSDELGNIPHLPAQASMGGLSEADFSSLIQRRLENLGFSVISEVWVVPKFPGFRVDPARLKKIRGLKADPDGRPVDLVAHNQELTILIETKISGVEGGLGQILLYGEIYRARVLGEGRRLELALAAPDYVWHPRLAAVCERVGVHAWQVYSGRLGGVR